MFFILYFHCRLQNPWTGGWKKSCPEGRAGTNERGKVMGKGVGGWIWFKKYVHTYVNTKSLLIETTPGIGGGGIKENGRGSEFT
jgi:hypothetical protein